MKFRFDRVVQYFLYFVDNVDNVEKINWLFIIFKQLRSLGEKVTEEIDDESLNLLTDYYIDVFSPKQHKVDKDSL